MQHEMTVVSADNIGTRGFQEQVDRTLRMRSGDGWELVSAQVVSNGGGTDPDVVMFWKKP